MKQNVQKEGPGTGTISTSMTIQSEGKIVSYTIRCDRFPGKKKQPKSLEIKHQPNNRLRYCPSYIFKKIKTPLLDFLNIN